MVASSSWTLFRWTLLSVLGAQLSACGGATSTEDGKGGGGDSASGGSGAGGGVSSGSGGTGASNAGGIPSCTNPSATGNGFVQCDEGYTHRPNALDCDVHIPRDELIGDPASCDPSTTECCLYDADCTQDNSYCVQVPDGFAPAYSYCAVGCVNDADCSAGSVCWCSEGGLGTCTQADCSADADCEGEARCSTWSIDQGCGPVVTFSCQTDQDSCGGAADCAAGEECALKSGARTCQPPEYICVVGRPFVVEKQARVAGLADRDDWASAGELLESLSSCIVGAELSQAERTTLFEHYAAIAQLEHASVAAFARFSMQLLALGAPVELVESCNQAMVDETRHARQCFAVASAFAGRSIGPAALLLEGALAAVDLEEIVALVFEEGCVGETVAALLALESAEACANSGLCRTLFQIAADEQQHAELAWRFVRWAVQQQPALGAVVRAGMTRELERSCASRRSAATKASELRSDASEMLAEERLAQWGMLSCRQAEQLRYEALLGVVAPCVDQLLRLSSAGAQGSTARADHVLLA